MGPDTFLSGIDRLVWKDWWDGFASGAVVALLGVVGLIALAEWLRP